MNITEYENTEQDITEHENTEQENTEQENIEQENIEQENTEQENTKQDNNVKYVYNYNLDFTYKNYMVATKNPRPSINNEYILPSYATFTKIPKYNPKTEYLIYQKIFDKWDIVNKIKTNIHFFDIKNYNKFFKTEIFYTNPDENIDNIINQYISNNKLFNYKSTNNCLPIYDKETQSIYFNLNKYNWDIYNFKNNHITLYLYDKNDYNIFFKQKIFYYNPSDKLEDIQHEIENKPITTIKIPKYNTNIQKVYFNKFIDNWEVVSILEINTYKNKINNLIKINELNFILNNEIIEYKKLLKKTDWIFLKDIDILTEECINNFKIYRSNIRNEIFILKKNMDNISFEFNKKLFKKPVLIFKNN